MNDTTKPNANEPMDRKWPGVAIALTIATAGMMAVPAIAAGTAMQTDVARSMHARPTVDATPAQGSGRSMANAASNPETAGTTVLGADDASSVGLILMPWKTIADGDVDRAPRLYDAPLRPIDAAALHALIVLDIRRDELRQRRIAGNDSGDN
ncbi:hypothetical protein [Burkholderia anthina]|uniref:hypothetical protein n=1 Tax=Burkholderia anthina TaxID=179879 RepID=UPI00158CC671|nr:hypothetical protein [Burkholderia anthina]